MAIKKRSVRKNNIDHSNKVLNEKNSEPSFDKIITTDDLLNGIKWYNKYADVVKSKLWLLEYMKIIGYHKNDIFKVKSFSWNRSGLEIQNGDIVSLKFAGFVARMYLRGLTDIPEIYKKRLDTAITYCLKYFDKNIVKKNIDDAEPNQNKISVHDHINVQVSSLCAEIEGEVDDFYDNGFKTNLNMYDWLSVKEVKGLIAKKIGDNFRPLLKEIEDIKYDEDLKEAYRHFKRNDIKKYRSFLQTIIDDCDRYSSSRNKERKPRKKKPITVDKLVSKLNYKKEDLDFKINSIDPVKIIGSTQIWVFNTKYRKIGVYNASKPTGLTIKGSTLQGFDGDKSVQKVVRKPEQILSKFQKNSITTIKKEFENIRTKEQKMTGRINSDTILLKNVT